MRNSVFFGLLFLFFWSCKNESKNAEPQTFVGNAYGSTFSIVYYADEDFSDEIEGILNAFDASVNTYIDDSFLSVFNQSEHGTKADSMLLEMTDLAMNFHQKTDGFYEPSVMPLSQLWGFSKEGLQHSPSQHEVDSVLAFVGMAHVRISHDSLLKNDARFEMNFNSMTGYVNDEIGKFFDAQNIENYMIEIGGEVLAKGKKPDGRLWSIGIDEPMENAPKRKLNSVVSLENEALAISGNYRKFFIDDATGQKIVHTINPKTGYAKPSALLSASVIAPTCAEADATATALMAMGLDKAKTYIASREDLKFYLIWSVGDSLQSETFNGFERLAP